MDRRETKKMTRKRTMKNWKNVNREMQRENKLYPVHMVQVPREKWPKTQHGAKCEPLNLWRSRDFVAQVVREPNGAIRIAVNRTRMNEDYDFADGISWDDLWRIKNEIGFSDRDCIEIYPAQEDIINVANIRHLFVLPEKHEWNWNSK